MAQAEKLVYDVSKGLNQKPKRVKYDYDEEKQARQHAISVAHERRTEIRMELQSTDYKVLQYVEGVITEEEFTELKATRQQLRNEYNQLESEV